MDDLYDINFQINDKFYKIRIYYNNISNLYIMEELVKSSILDKVIKNIALKKISICNHVKFIYLERIFFIKIYLSELDFESSCQESKKVLKFKERLQKYILIIHQRDSNTKS
jgi:hypothetical protein